VFGLKQSVTGLNFVAREGEAGLIPAVINLEWFVSAVLAAACITVLDYFEEKTPLYRRLSKWTTYFGVTTALLCGPEGGPGRSSLPDLT